MTMKMTLIDKDKFIQDVISRKYSQASMRLIREQPEVKAIPIEWINEWYWNNSDICCDKHVSELFGKMIKDWKKENDNEY